MIPVAEFLSEPKEVHALFHGLHRAVFGALGYESPQADDARAEVHYYKLGFLLGRFIIVSTLMTAGAFLYP